MDMTQKSCFPKDVREPALILFTLPISPYGWTKPVIHQVNSTDESSLPIFLEDVFFFLCLIHFLNQLFTHVERPQVDIQEHFFVEVDWPQVSVLATVVWHHWPHCLTKCFTSGPDLNTFKELGNVSNILFSCWGFLPSIQAIGLVWFGITTESTWFTCTPVVSKSAIGSQQFRTIYISIFIEHCIWLFNAFLVEIDQLPNLSHLSFL